MGKRVAIRLLVGIVLVTLAVVFAPWLMFVFDRDPLFPRETESFRGVEAGEAYAKHMKPFFKLPEAAQFVEFKLERQWVDEVLEAKFLLDHSRSPEAWLKQIWSGNGFPVGDQETANSYSFYFTGYEPQHGLRELSFDPQTGHYTALVGTD